MSSVWIPPGQQTFFDLTGKPLSLGTIELYIPTTFTPKLSWADEAQSVVNQNPLPLDASGSAPIWGIGLYRMIAKDEAGATVFDKITGFAASGGGGGVIGPDISVSGHVVTWASTDGTQIADGGIALSALGLANLTNVTDADYQAALLRGSSIRIIDDGFSDGYNAAFGSNVSGQIWGLQIGGAVANDGPSGSSIHLDGHSSFMRVQPTRNESSQEVVIYSSGAQGFAISTMGGNTLTRVSGTVFAATWVGLRIYWNEAAYKVATVAGDGQSLTVTDTAGGGVTFPGATTEVFQVAYVYGSGICNVVGTTVTRVSGDPFIPFTASPFQLKINGVARAVASFTSVDEYQLSAPPGNASGVSYSFYTTINDQITTFRLQRIIGSDEENLSLYSRYDGYWIHSLFAGSGQYRKVILGSGEISTGVLARQLVAQKTGDLSIGGDYGYEAIRVLAANNGVNRWQTVPASTGFGVVWEARGSDTDVSGTIDMQGIGSFVLTNGSFTRVILKANAGVGATDYIELNASTGIADVSAKGSSSDVDLSLTPKGAGLLRFGSRSALAAETVTGYITIKDAGGTLRKLAVVS